MSNPISSPAAVRPSPIFLALLVAMAAGGVLANGGGSLARPGVFILVLAGWVISLCLHEFAHAFAAWRFGDSDVALRGYLTLNPLKYTHPLLSIVLPIVFIALGGIGLPGGAVYLNTAGMPARRRTIIALAGPAANLGCGMLLLGLVAGFGGELSFIGGDQLWYGLAFLGYLQLMAVVLNLLPIPGLDGYAALEPHLAWDTRRSLAPLVPWGFFIVIAVLQVPPLANAFFAGVEWLFGLSGLPTWYAGVGSSLFRFWNEWF